LINLTYILPLNRLPDIFESDGFYSILSHIIYIKLIVFRPQKANDLN